MNSEDSDQIDKFPDFENFGTDMVSKVTEEIRVDVQASYLPDQSDPESEYYFFAYLVTISNLGKSAVQLLNRHWIITNSQGHVEEVRGAGVVGEQPRILPGQSFQYS